MSISQIYNKIINHNNIEEVIYPILKNLHTEESLEIIKIEKQELDGFPFLLVHEKYNRNMPCEYFARYMSTPMDLSFICPEAKEYYFPYICLPDQHPIFAKKLMIENIEGVMAHEVCHIKTILEYTDKNPDYYEDLKKFGFNYFDDIRDLEKSLFFEINKRLLIETPALRVEYEAGNTSIPVPVLFFVKKLKCQSSEEFVKINLLSELHDLFEAYKKKFQDNTHFVEETFKKVLNSVSSQYLTEDAFTEICNIYKQVYSRLGVPGF